MFNKNTSQNCGCVKCDKSGHFKYIQDKFLFTNKLGGIYDVRTLGKETLNT